MNVYLNEDFTHFWITRYNGNINVTEEVLRDFIRQYEPTCVTDFVLNVGGFLSASFSDIVDNYAKKYEKTHENGIAVDYKDSCAKILYDLKRQGIDPYGVWVEEITKSGMNPWISIRMNDCHYALESKVHLVKPEEREQHPEWWVCNGREAVGYFDKCFNYLVPEVRILMLSYIEEQLSRYDVYGLELDFSREPFCFPAGHEDIGRKAMLGFMADVKNLVDGIAKKRGKNIKISMLCPASPTVTYQLGFDVAQMVKNGYVDAVVPGPRWATINLDIPLEMWRNILGDNVKLGAIQQLLVTGYPFSKDVCSDTEMAFGQAAAFTCKGADLIYFYNLFDSVEKGIDTRMHENSIRAHWEEILMEIGKLENIDKWNRRCPLTYDDFVGLTDPLAVRLPITIPAGGGAGVRMVTGKILPDQEVYLNIETAEPVNAEDLTVYVNGRRANYVMQNMADPYIVKQNAYSFKFSADVQTAVGVEIFSKCECKIEYIDVLICGK